MTFTLSLPTLKLDNGQNPKSHFSTMGKISKSQELKVLKKEVPHKFQIMITLAVIIDLIYCYPKKFLVTS